MWNEKQPCPGFELHFLSIFYDNITLQTSQNFRSNRPLLLHFLAPCLCSFCHECCVLLIWKWRSVEMILLKWSVARNSIYHHESNACPVQDCQVSIKCCVFYSYCMFLECKSYRVRQCQHLSLPVHTQSVPCVFGVCYCLQCLALYKSSCSLGLAYFYFHIHIQLLEPIHQFCLYTILNINWNDFITNIKVLETAKRISIKAILLHWVGHIARIEDNSF